MKKKKLSMANTSIQRLILLTRLVEWFELLAALGAEKIFLYNLEVHPNVTKVLYYVFPSFFYRVAYFF